MASERKRLDFADDWEDFFDVFSWEEILNLLKEHPDLFSWVESGGDDAVAATLQFCSYSTDDKLHLLRKVLSFYNADHLNEIKYIETILNTACEMRDADVFIELLCAHGADASIPEDGYGHPMGRLLRTLTNKPTDVLLRSIDLLLKYGGKLNYPDTEFAYTPLQYACASGTPEIITFLHKRGARLERGGDDETPLTTAVGHDKYENVECLLKLGANVNGHGTSWPYTALDIAYMRKNQRIIDLLLKHGGKTNMRELKELLNKAIGAGKVKPNKKKRH